MSRVELFANEPIEYLGTKDMRLAMQLEVEYRLRARDGTRMSQRLYASPHRSRARSRAGAGARV